MNHTSVSVNILRHVGRAHGARTETETVLVITTGEDGSRDRYRNHWRR